MANGEITPGELRARFDLATLDPSEVELPGVGTTGGVARGGGILWSSLVAAAAQNVIQEIESTFTPTADISTQVADRAGQGFYDAAGLHVSNSTTAGDFTLVASLGGGGSGDLLAANNLSDLVDAVLARANLGLGTAATQASTAFEASGAVAAHAAAADPHSQYNTDAEVSALIAAALGAYQTQASHDSSPGNFHSVIQVNDGTTAGQTIGDVVPSFIDQIHVFTNTTPAVLYVATGTTAGSVIQVGSTSSGGSGTVGGHPVIYTTGAVDANGEVGFAGGILSVRENDRNGVAIPVATLLTGSTIRIEDEAAPANSAVYTLTGPFALTAGTYAATATEASSGTLTDAANFRATISAKGDTGAAGTASSTSGLILTGSTAPATGVGETGIFRDSVDGILKQRDENSGAITELGAGAAVPSGPVIVMQALLSANTTNTQGISTHFPVIFDSEIVDTDGIYDPTTGIISSAVERTVTFSATLRLNGSTTSSTRHAINLHNLTDAVDVGTVQREVGGFGASTFPVLTTGALPVVLEAGKQYVVRHLNGGSNFTEIFGNATGITNVTMWI